MPPAVLRDDDERASFCVEVIRQSLEAIPRTCAAISGNYYGGGLVDFIGD